MTPIELTDPTDPRVAVYTRLSDAAMRRRNDAKHGMYMAESSVVVRRALKAGHQPYSFFLSHRYLDSMADVFAENPDIPVYTGTDEMMQSITGFHLHRGALAAMRRPEPLTTDQVTHGARRIAILEDIVDHTNLGSIIRSAAGLGIDGIILSPQCADPLYRRAIRVSMGSVFELPWTRSQNLPEALNHLKHQGWSIAALELTEHSINIDDAEAQHAEKLAMILGTEGAGVSARSLENADVHLQIPIRETVDSLNVSVAAAVAFWQLRSRAV